MAEEQRHIELFDKYVLGTLTSKEQDELEEMVSKDPKLKLEFETHKLLAKGVKMARKEELKEYLKEHGKVQYFENIWGPRWRKASVAIVAFFVVAYFAVDFMSKKSHVPKTAQEQKEYKKKESDSAAEPSEDLALTKPEVEDIEEAKVPPPPPPVLEIVEDDIELVDTVEGEYVIEDHDLSNFKVPASNAPAKEKPGKILQDEKLRDTSVVMLVAYRDIQTKRVASTSLENADVVVAKKRKDKLEKEERKASKYLEQDKAEEELVNKDSVENRMKLKTTKVLVEYWKSPVNFKGYQYQNSLKLYGVDGQQVKLVNYLGVTYLKLNDKYCKLTKSTDFSPFTFITDEQLVEELDAY